MNNKYTTILIGNGLGMAISPTSFSIDSGLKAAWKRIDTETQGRIKSLMNSDDLDNEDQLDAHYPAIHACQMLSKIEDTSNFSWLDKGARDFPIKFSKYIEDVAKHFFEYVPTIDELDQMSAFNNVFVRDLSKYILENKVHLVTLNYDKLLYREFITNQQIMKGKNGKLLDGFYVDTRGFSPAILDQRKEGQGFYLHLHGSPLFYTNADTNELDKDHIVSHSYERKKHFIREHLILCNTKQKFSQISGSPILRTYWEYFNLALQQSEKLILLGYSSKDAHINEVISKTNNPNRKIIVVEHSVQEMQRKEREIHWQRLLNLPENYFHNDNLIWRDSILDYEFNE